MLKKNLLKSLALLSVTVCMLLSAACGGDTASLTEQASSQSGTKVVSDRSDTGSSVTGSSVTGSEPNPSAVSSGAESDAIVKVNGGADKVGIYSVVVRLTDKAADKGVIEMVYYGAKGSPQENSVVNTFRIEYYKESAGTYEINTFYDGEVYQNHHHKDEVKVTNTFGATLRAGEVVISYTPDGGETREIFRADAEYFFAAS